MVLALEVVEHVPHPEAFVATACSLVRPGGLFVLSTLNRTAKSFMLAIVGAEYVLHWLPRGTHRWDPVPNPRGDHGSDPTSRSESDRQVRNGLRSVSRPLGFGPRYGRELPYRGSPPKVGDDLTSQAHPIAGSTDHRPSAIFSRAHSPRKLIG